MTAPKNRNPVSSFFITFPQWTLHSKSELFQEITNLYDSVYACICQETHEDGQPHFHVCMKVKTPATYTSLIKRFKSLYPEDYKRIDVQPLKNWKSSLDYVQKEDGELQELGDRPVRAFLSASDRRRQYRQQLLTAKMQLEAECARMDKQRIQETRLRDESYAFRQEHGFSPYKDRKTDEETEIYLREWAGFPPSYIKHFFEEKALFDKQV